MKKKDTLAAKRNINAFSKKPDFKFKFDGYEAVHPESLETFTYEYPGSRTEIVIDTDEFTAVCPWSGLPDFAKITVKYVPDKKIIELRSFKYYLYSYRNVGIFQEHLTQRVLADLVDACGPLEMTVTADYSIRGGVHTVTSASYKKKK